MSYKHVIPLVIANIKDFERTYVAECVRPESNKSRNVRVGRCASVGDTTARRQRQVYDQADENIACGDHPTIELARLGSS